MPNKLRSVLSRPVPRDARTKASEYRSIYDSLPLGPAQTRVLVLHPSLSGTGRVKCSLEVITVDPKPTKAYTALSYVWGDSSVTEDITVNGTVVGVTTNLATALRHLRRDFGKITLWADALSVNQLDSQERSHQVLHMKRIFSRAERVIGWVGPDENGGSYALASFRRMFEAMIQDPDHPNWLQKMKDFYRVDRREITKEGNELGVNETLEKMEHFLNRPFWKRVWIFQELVLPRNLRLMCGNEFMDIPGTQEFVHINRMWIQARKSRPQFWPIDLWMQFSEGWNDILKNLATFRHEWHQINSSSVKSSIQREESTYFNGVLGLLLTKHLFDDHEATDPRDQVYGLLGLVDIDIIPDYSTHVTAADVYIDVARRAITAGSPSILFHAGLLVDLEQPKSATRLLLPSWVPDWTVTHNKRSTLATYPQCHAYRTKDRRLHMQPAAYNAIRGYGVVWDTVSRFDTEARRHSIEWDLVKTVDFESMEYLPGISHFEAFVLLLLGGRDPLNESDPLHLGTNIFRECTRAFFYNMLFQRGKDGGPAFTNVTMDYYAMFRSRTPNAPDLWFAETYVNQVANVLYNRVIFHTSTGCIGLGPLCMEEGDQICALQGYKCPVVLRPVESYYVLVGNCDVVGLMTGEVPEAVEDGKATVVEIEIR